MSSPFRYLSVCSGIEAASVAWKPLGWQAAGYSEIEPFPRAVLEQRLGAVAVDWEHRHSEQSNILPLFGDFTQIEEHHVGPVDLLVGGTPCQSFSIAGKRLGLDDPRGNLAIEFLALARRLRPRWLVWENVPGVRSSWSGEAPVPPDGPVGGGWHGDYDESCDFAAFLDLFRECGYRGGWRSLDAQYVRVAGYERAVPQRRERVFVVGYLGDFARAATVLFDRESLSGHPAPRREAGEGAAPTIAARPSGGGGLGTDFDCDGGLIASPQEFLGERAGEGVCQSGPVQLRADGIVNTVSAKWAKGSGGPAGDECQNLVGVAPTVRAGGNATGGDRPYGMDVDTADSLIPVVLPYDTTQITSPENGSNPQPGDPCGTLNKAAHPPAIAIQERAVSENPGAGPQGAGWQEGIGYTLEARNKVQAVAFSAADDGGDATAGLSPTLRSYGGQGTNGGGYMSVALDGQPSTAMPANDGSGNVRRGHRSGYPSTDEIEWRAQPVATAHGWQVRRLTPRECERLQGFPDDWTQIAWRGNDTALCPDGPRYKANGNNMAVNVMRWIGERIDLVEQVTGGEA